MRRILETSPTLLIVCPRRIGDVFLVTAIIESLKSRLERLSIDILVFEGTEKVLEANPHINKVLVIEARPGAKRHFRFMRQIWKKYDYSISMMSGDRPTLYASLAAKVSYGVFESGLKNLWKRILLSKSVEAPGTDMHRLLLSYQICEQFVDLKIFSPKIYVSSDRKSNVQNILRHNNVSPKYVVIHLTPQFRYKEWPLREWEALIGKLVNRDLNVIITGTRHGSNVGDEGFSGLRGNSPLVLDLVDQLSLTEVASLIEGAMLFVGTDTAVTHIAASLNTPTIAIFGPSNPIVWGPWPKNYLNQKNPWVLKGTQAIENVLLVQPTRHCVPCFMEGCDRHVESESECLTSLRAEEVLGCIDRLIQR